MPGPEPRGLEGDRLARLVDRDPQCTDGLACRPESLVISGRRDQYLREVDNADQPGGILFVPDTEEAPGSRMVRIGAVERADQDTGVEHDPQRFSSSASSCSR